MNIASQQTAPGDTPGMSPGATPECRRQRAKALVARLRHQQLLSALSGKVVESAVYAQRAWRVRRTVCNCAV